MKIGELFVDLGIKGTDKTVGSISQVQSGMSGLAATSLETKAAIIAAFYAVERLFSSSGQMGTGLLNLEAVLGRGSKEIQQYQYAARQAGVSNEELAGSFKTIQDKMTAVLFQGQRPEGFDLIGMRMGHGFTAGEIKEFSDRPEKLLQVLQKYAQVEQNVGLRNKALRSFGVGDNMIAALVRGEFTESNLNRAPILSEGAIKSLDRSRAAWSNLGTTIELAFARFNAQDGGKLISDVTKMTLAVIHLTEALVKLGEKAGIFTLIGKLTDFTSKEVNDVADDKGNSWTAKFLTLMGKVLDPLNTEASFTDLAKLGDQVRNGAVPRVGSKGVEKNQTLNVTNHNNFQHDGKNAQQVGREIGDQVKKAGGQIRQYQTN